MSKTTMPSLIHIGRDWQITALLSDNLFVETDCNTGDKRQVRKTQCSCGEPMLIEYNAQSSCRSDKKRVFYPDDTADSLWGAFRCRVCREPVNETVAYAEYG